MATRLVMTRPTPRRRFNDLRLRRRCDAAITIFNWLISSEATGLDRGRGQDRYLPSRSPRRSRPTPRPPQRPRRRPGGVGAADKGRAEPGHHPGLDVGSDAHRHRGPVVDPFGPHSRPVRGSTTRMPPGSIDSRRRSRGGGQGRPCQLGSGEIRTRWMSMRWRRAPRGVSSRLYSTTTVARSQWTTCASRHRR